MESEQFTGKERLIRIENFTYGIEHEDELPQLDALSDGTYIDVDYSILELISEIKKLKIEEFNAKKRRDDLEIELRGAIGKAEYCLYGGEILATLKTTYRKEFTVKASSFRKLIVK